MLGSELVFSPSSSTHHSLHSDQNNHPHRDHAIHQCRGGKSTHEPNIEPAPGRTPTDPQTAVTDAAKDPVGAASNIANTAASYLPGSASAASQTHSHSEEHSAHGKQLPPDAAAGEVKKMDSEGLAVFEDEGVRHAVLVKINKLAM